MFDSGTNDSFLAVRTCFDTNLFGSLLLLLLLLRVCLLAHLQTTKTKLQVKTLARTVMRRMRMCRELTATTVRRKICF